MRVMTIGLTVVLLLGCGGAEPPDSPPRPQPVRSDPRKPTESSAWEAARKANTTAAYQRYLAAHPRGRHASQARRSAQQLAWRAARDGDRAALEAFLKAHPRGPYSGDAHRRLNTLDFEAARTEATLPGLLALLERRTLTSSLRAEIRAEVNRLRRDPAPFEAARQANTRAAFEQFLRDHPGHVKARQVQSLLEALDAVDVFELLERRQIALEIRGRSIRELQVRVTPTQAGARPLVRFPAGAFYVPVAPTPGKAPQRMFGVRVAVVAAGADGPLPVACANRALRAPRPGDRYRLVREPQPRALSRLAPLLAPVWRGANGWAVAQAATWIVTDDCTASSLRGLRSGLAGAPGSAVIGPMTMVRAQRVLQRAGVDLAGRTIGRDAGVLLEALATLSEPRVAPAYRPDTAEVEWIRQRLNALGHPGASIADVTLNLLRSPTAPLELRAQACSLYAHQAGRQALPTLLALARDPKLPSRPAFAVNAALERLLGPDDLETILALHASERTDDLARALLKRHAERITDAGRRREIVRALLAALSARKGRAWDAIRSALAPYADALQTADLAALVARPETGCRAAAASLLRHLADPQATELLVRLLADRERMVRDRAVSALQGRHGALTPLGRATRARDATTREAVARALGGIPGSRDHSGLVRLLDDPDVRVRDAALKAVLALGNPPAAKAALRRRVADEPALIPRLRAIGLLGRARDPADVPRLAALLSEREPKLRIAAIQALGQLGHASALPILQRHRQQATSRAERRGIDLAIRLIGQAR